ncbi:MAG: hypothetical protein QF792_04305 [Phycisphaerae bacterium]|nr:hypothetical protein [Phycisphaerae bacterium]
MFDYSEAADDFFVNLNLQTTLALPNSREGILHFFEAVQRDFRAMASFYQRETGEYVLESNRQDGSYSWLELETNHMTAGFFNPPSLEEAYRLHRWLLDRSVYFLGISGLDVECLDILFGFNLDYDGNRDAIVAEALLGDSPLAALVGEDTAQCVECEPSLIIAIDEECYMQARISVETHSSSFQVRAGQYDDEPISIYFTIRRYPTSGKIINMTESLARQCKACEDLTQRIVIPQVVRPVALAIATAQ